MFHYGDFALIIFSLPKVNVPFFFLLHCSFLVSYFSFYKIKAFLFCFVFFLNGCCLNKHFMIFFQKQLIIKSPQWKPASFFSFFKTLTQRPLVIL